MWRKYNFTKEQYDQYAAYNVAFSFGGKRYKIVTHEVIQLAINLTAKKRNQGNTQSGSSSVSESFKLS